MSRNSILALAPNALSVYHAVRYGSKKRYLDFTLNHIWQWGSCSGDLGSVKYYFIVITLRSILTKSNIID